MAIAPVLKTGVRKDIRVRIPGPPFEQGALSASQSCIRAADVSSAQLAAYFRASTRVKM